MKCIAITLASLALVVATYGVPYIDQLLEFKELNRELGEIGIPEEIKETYERLRELNPAKEGMNVVEFFNQWDIERRIIDTGVAAPNLGKICIESLNRTTPVIGDRINDVYTTIVNATKQPDLKAYEFYGKLVRDFTHIGEMYAAAQVCSIFEKESEGRL